jgi:hypothetical protein
VSSTGSASAYDRQGLWLDRPGGSHCDASVASECDGITGFAEPRGAIFKLTHDTVHVRSSAWRS